MNTSSLLIRSTPESISNSMLNGLPPVVDSESLVLVLGTFPGSQSLQHGEYYFDRSNKLWQVLLGVLEVSSALPYHQRVAQLLSHRIALWDVIDRCRRKGSKDRDIKDPVANDLITFLQNHKSIKHIIFNGEDGRKSASRWAKSLIPEMFELPGIEIHRFTSTSGLNTRYTVEQKVNCWSEIRNYLVSPNNSDVNS